MESESRVSGERPAENAQSEGVAEESQSWLEDWLEFFPSVLMALAVVLTAYSAYEATRWSGVQATDFATASSLRTQANSLTTLGATQTAYDANVFGELLLAFRDQDLADPQTRREALAFADRLFRDEFKPALEEWLLLQPLQDPSAPATPMELEGYFNANLEEAKRLGAQADESFLAAKQANQNGDDYILATILFAAVLFFTGLRLKAARAHTLVVSFAAICLVAGVSRLATLPFQ